MNRLFRITMIIILITLTIGCNSRPKEAGIFLKNKKEWIKLQEFNIGIKGLGFEESAYMVYGTGKVSQLSFAFDESESKRLLINNVPLDPTTLYIADVTGRAIDNDVLFIKVRKQPVSAVSKGQNIYEVTIPNAILTPKNNEKGGRTFALVSMSRNSAYFFNTSNPFKLGFYPTTDEE